jgi:hypothetical protein
MVCRIAANTSRALAKHYVIPIFTRVDAFYGGKQENEIAQGTQSCLQGREINAANESLTRNMAESGSRADKTVSGAANAASGGLAGLQGLIERAGEKRRGPAPVEKWEPEYCGELDMEIRRDGTWFYMGTPIGRQALVDLFATVLRKDEDGETYLVTPVEKIRIGVEDAHFIAVEMNVADKGDGQVMTFRTNVGDVVEAGPEHPLTFVAEGEHGGVKPYLRVRGRLDALLARSVMYELVEHGEEAKVDGKTMFAVRSNGVLFPIMPADELERLAAQ